MSLGDRESPYHKSMDNRTKINNLVFPNESSRDFPRCLNCVDQPRLEIRKDTDGNRIGICVRSCGQTFNLEKTVNEETGGTLLAPKRYTSKYGSVGKQHSFIISQKSKKKEIDKSDRNDIQKAFGATDGVRVIDERTEYYQDQGR